MDPRSAALAPTLQEGHGASAFIVQEGARLCRIAAGDQVHAIVLSGSISRGEATLKRDSHGWRVLGDATFVILTDGPAELGVRELEREIGRSLLSRQISCKVAVVTSTMAELQKLKPHIYAYELRERGVVIWGDKGVLDGMPSFRAAEIPKEDGWWLLCNRMIEQLETAADTRSSHNSSAVEYRIAKLYLAMAACYLLVIDQYEPSYRERAERLASLAGSTDPVESPIPFERFSKYVWQCTQLKLQGEKIGPSGDFPTWHDAVHDAELLWRWVLGRILTTDSRTSREALLGAMAARQSPVARSKSWIRAAYVQPWVAVRDCIRWARFAVSTSPRYLVYSAASELFFASSDPDGVTADELAVIVANLPLSHPEPGNKLTWPAAAKLIATNFHVLLESTRS
ncbi:MAG: hypothetical protein JO356_12700 [Acidobacteria bacterium]|nr:hypothetical protein [Acidobacteriota bacterium]